MAINQRAIKLASSNTYSSTTNELLYGLLTGLNCIGYEAIVVNDSGVSVLTPPDYAVIALLVVEPDAATTDKKKVIRFTEDNFTVPTNAIGMPLGELSIYETKGAVNMAAMKMIGIEAGKVHSVKVQYFG